MTGLSCIMPHRSRHKGLYAVAILVLGLMLWYSAQRSSYISPIDYSSPEHPIAQLTKRAEKQWADLLNKQSQTLEEAYTEYRRRYGRKPPKGFDDWYKWSTVRGLRLVDGIHDSLLPFWGLSPVQIESRRKEMIWMAESDRLFSLQIRSGEISDDPDGRASTKKWPINLFYYALVDGISQFLPDMDLTINLYDTPVVYASREHTDRLIALGKAGQFLSDEEHDAAHVENWESDMSWRDLQMSCPPGSPIFDLVPDLFGEVQSSPIWAQQQLAFRVPGAKGGFIHDHQAAMDLCVNPELLWQHGNYLTQQPTQVNFRRNYLYPVFSWSRYPTSSDILIPTSYRFQHAKSKVTPWDQLKPKIAWRGTLTGMLAQDGADTFASQRFRLASMMVDEHAVIQVYNSTGMISSKAGPLNQIWTELGVCGDPAELTKSHTANVAQAKLHFWPRMTDVERDGHKMLLDVDGWGWSARFRSLLWAGGAVVKATAFKEATSDWLIPWYHYIPLDYAYRDLYSILLYYLGIPGTNQIAHDQELRAIAEQSSQWVDEHGTWDHNLAYMYRLLLEWARIMSEDRDEMTYTFTGGS